MAAANEANLSGVDRSRILARAWPIILANAAVPLLGLADTAVIGNFAALEDLGAVALGGVIFSFVYWGFGFLRMGTTGFTAQAAGAGDTAEVRAAIGRAMALATVVGLSLFALQWPISTAALSLLEGSETVKAITADYFAIRIWGAPAALGVFAITGLLIGLGKSKTLLVLQLFLNGLNIVLDLIFAGLLGMGAEGIALGTAIAEWSALLLGLAITTALLKSQHSDTEPFLPRQRLRDWAKLRHTLAANTDIMIRTLLLVFSFAWFVRQGAGFGDDILAANHILLQMISFSAFFLDGYAFVAESLTGEAIGRDRRQHFDLAVSRSSELSCASALLLALGVWLLGPLAIDMLTTHVPVREAADSYLPLAAIYIAVSFAAFQLDGIFIGATRTRQMRNAAIASTALFLLLSLPLVERFGNNGLWAAFIGYVIARAVTLGWYYPALRGSISEQRGRWSLDEH